MENNSQAIKIYWGIINDAGNKCIVALNYDEALDQLHKEHIDIIICSLKLSYECKEFLINEVNNIERIIPLIIITENDSIEQAVDAMKNGTFDYLVKPVSKEKLETVLKNAITFIKENKRTKEIDEDATQPSYMEGIIGKSKAMYEIAQIIKKVASNNSNIFISGESGTGKELIARYIHKMSLRNDKPFIPIDCSVLPPNLLESELFGYEKGAFTGADRFKPGILEQADKGTLFLDEITELDFSLQAKLLRFIQEKHFRRIGGTKMCKVDVRIISATNRDPRDAVKQKILREDLYYRINVISINAPPLRNKKEDIPSLVQYFIKKFNKTQNKKITGISNETMDCLLKYDWPGNVRELQNIVELLCVLSDKTILEIDNLPNKFFQYYNVKFDDDISNKSYHEAKEIYYKDFCKHFFQNLLRECNGNISKASRVAGISRKSIYRILNELDIKKTA